MSDEEENMVAITPVAKVSVSLLFIGYVIRADPKVCPYSLSLGYENLKLYSSKALDTT